MGGLFLVLVGWGWGGGVVCGFVFFLRSQIVTREKVNNNQQEISPELKPTKTETYFN